MKTIPKTLSGFFWHYIKKQWKLMLAAQVFCFAWSLDHTLWPVWIMMVIDTLTNFQGERTTMWSALATPILFGISLWIGIEVCFRFAGVLMALIFPRFEAEIRMEMFEYVSQHSHLYFSNNFAGSIANKISDMPQCMTRIMQMIMGLFLPVLLAFAISTALFAAVQPIFAFILVGWAIVHLGICLWFSPKCDELSNVHATARTNLSGKIVDCLTNNSNVRLFARSRYEIQYLNKFQKDEQDKHWASLWYIEKMKCALGFASLIGVGFAMMYYMLYSWQQGYITTGEVVFIFNTTWNITMMIWLAGLELPQLFKEIGVCRQAMTIIQDAHGVVDKEHAQPLSVKRGEIAFDHVTFHYVPNNSIFHDKNIMIGAGEKVGLVGFSGSGKTTFVNLILRYYDVEKGRILIDNQDISDVTQVSLREQIAMIPQDASLFHRSIIENIRYGRLGASDEEVIEASKKANCHEFVMQMPEGYNSMVGERGIKLSGGQRQRIAIARAILKNAPILILDEATSSLDSVTEKHIQEGLEHLIDGRTTIVIAHRLSTLSGMDRILVFNEGKIVEEGSHEELLTASGHYAKMWNMQAGGFLPDEE